MGAVSPRHLRLDTMQNNKKSGDGAECPVMREQDFLAHSEDAEDAG